MPYHVIDGRYSNIMPEQMNLVICFLFLCRLTQLVVVVIIIVFYVEGKSASRLGHMSSRKHVYTNTVICLTFLFILVLINIMIIFVIIIRFELLSSILIILLDWRPK